MSINQKFINESLDSALENGYDLLDWSDEMIAQDLGDYDPQFQGVPVHELVPFVQNWRNSK